MSVQCMCKRIDYDRTVTDQIDASGLSRVYNPASVTILSNPIFACRPTSRINMTRNMIPHSSDMVEKVLCVW